MFSLQRTCREIYNMVSYKQTSDLRLSAIKPWNIKFDQRFKKFKVFQNCSKLHEIKKEWPEIKWNKIRFLKIISSHLNPPRSIFGLLDSTFKAESFSHWNHAMDRIGFRVQLGRWCPWNVRGMSRNRCKMKVNSFQATDY